MFRSNVPVTAEGFFDRRKELEQLEQLVGGLEEGSPRWMAIIGARKIGKTSLLLELQRRASTQSIPFVVLDSFEQLPLSLEIFRRYGLRVIDGLLSSEIGLSLLALARQPDQFRTALQESTRFSGLPPALRGQLLELPERRVDEVFLEQVLHLPEQLAEKLDLHVVVAWDEFQELAELRSGRKKLDVFPLLRSVWQRHQRVSYIISGSRRTMLTELVTTEDSPFFQQFSLMALEPFSRTDGVELLTSQAKRDRKIPSTTAQKAVAAIGGHPFYLQMLGEVLTAREPPYDENALKEAVQELLFSRTGRLALYFEGQYQSLVGRSTGLAAALGALAEGPCRLKDVSREIKAPSGTTVRYLERLGDAVEHTDDGTYRFADSTFAKWLRWRKPGGSVVPMSIVGDEAEIRVAEHLASMGFDLVYQSRASRGAFDLLATRGSHQLGLQIKRSQPPLRFKKNEWRRMEAEGKRFGWRWVVAAVLPPPSKDILILNPAEAEQAREIRLASEASIVNLLSWLDTPQDS
jgi:AAA+ ATPase superfamily predicted ATPase